MRGTTHNSRTKRTIKVKVPGGRVSVHQKKGKPSPAVCAETGQKLPGVPRINKGNRNKYAKSQRRPERPFGGILSSKAMREFFIKKVRSTEQ